MIKYLSLILLSFALGACSSGGGGGGTSPVTYKYNMSGSYTFPNITVSSAKGNTVEMKAATSTFTLKWNESAQTITGTYTDENNVVSTVTGKIQGSTREILVTFNTVVAGSVKSLLFSADEAAITSGNLTNATVVAKNASGTVVDTGTFNATIEFPDDGEHGGGPALSCSGDPSGDMASWGFMKGCRYYKVIHSVSNYNCPYPINTPINIGINGDGTAKVLVNDDTVFDGSIVGSPHSSASAGTFKDPNPAATVNFKTLNLSYSSGVPTTGSVQVIENSSVSILCVIEYVEDL